MPILKTAPRDLGSSLERAFGAPRVEVIELDRTGDYLFRIYDRDTSPFPELEVTLEALEDWDLQTITADIFKDGLVEWMKRHPSFRLRYGNDRRIDHFENLSVQCHGELFRIVRETGGNVRFYDAKDQLIGDPVMRVLNTSIFKKSEERWCEEIRQLRPHQ